MEQKRWIFEQNPESISQLLILICKNKGITTVVEKGQNIETNGANHFPKMEYRS